MESRIRSLPAVASATITLLIRGDAFEELATSVEWLAKSGEHCRL
jgi:hypothetical protein